MQPTPENVRLAQAVAKAIGIEPQVFPYYDNDRKNHVDILKLTDPVDTEVGIYVSVGLSDHENLVEVRDGHDDIRVELLAAAYKRFEYAPNVLSTAAFYIIKDKYECRPGGVFKHLVAMYDKGSAMKHIYFTAPFLWQDKLAALDPAVKKAAFLLLIPISDAELDYKLQHGDEALETLFEENEINIYDLERSSVV